MKFDFFAEPAAVIEYLKAKRPEIHFDYDEIMHATHHSVFTVAKITRLDLLADIQSSLVDAANKGKGFKEWKNELLPTLAKKGWLGDVSVTDPRTGKTKQIYVGSRRLKNIYNTNMRVAYSTARYNSQINSDAEFFRYVAVIDGRTRASHRALHGVILPKADKFWDTHYPPNAWNCRCQVRAYTKRELDENGWSVSGNVPNVPPHPDWTYNVGKTDNLENVFAQKIDKLPQTAFKERLEDELKTLKDDADIYTWKQGLNAIIEDVIVKDNVKTPINMVQVGFLSEAIAKIASKILDKDIQSGGIILTKKELTHASPKRKDAYAHALRVEEMKQIVDVLQDESKAYVDLRKKKENILFVFEDENDRERINLIPIEISKIHKKFKQSNYVITLDKFFKQEFTTLIKNGEIKNIK
ncbi:phage minor head protein [Campylobacter sp. RM9328]|uniref:phage head morphogenesis protein n=1 Tax=Campylobacter sp. RM9328 TaxID=1705720 RepID=UPI00147305C6|nr:phage minor head protein [Campylobacter sp. RM9328]